MNSNLNVYFKKNTSIIVSVLAFATVILVVAPPIMGFDSHGVYTTNKKSNSLLQGIAQGS
ncbi:MAG TPA: hypothetical protein VFG45_01800 [Candidatus Nitrosocosmicus sp.]|nr:hypothetical protein [Candidatus Nitrosocosmicus sp.]